MAGAGGNAELDKSTAELVARLATGDSTTAAFQLWQRVSTSDSAAAVVRANDGVSALVTLATSDIRNGATVYALACLANLELETADATVVLRLCAAGLVDTLVRRLRECLRHRRDDDEGLLEILLRPCWSLSGHRLVRTQTRRRG